MILPRHYRYSSAVHAPAEALFHYLDDHAQLSSHMSESSWMMGNGKMRIEWNGSRCQRACRRSRAEIAPLRSGSMLTVFIDYALPESGPGRWLGKVFAGFYARWCTQQMVMGATRHFAQPAPLARGTS